LNLDRERSQTLGKKFNVEGIPSLIVLSSSLETITLEGVDEVRCDPELSLTKWSEGKCLFWSREPQKDEYVWEDSQCSKCFMKPLIGSRHGCGNKECQFDLCETCLTKNNHEHPLVEYLFPNQKYSLEKILLSVPYLLDPKREEQIQTKTLLQDDIKSLGFYFSAHWCQPCRLFTPELAELYQEVQKSSQPFHIIFISSDANEDSFNEYRSEMPWLAVPFNSTAVIKKYFQVNGEMDF
jgi:thiol-disulfide isomerase/thioredoxin